MVLSLVTGITTVTGKGFLPVFLVLLVGTDIGRALEVGGQIEAGTL